jgi:selenocysteine lyase/cysteine desulfurase
MLDPTPYRALFPITQRYAFFNHAGVSALNTRALEAMRTFNEQSSHTPINEMFGTVMAALHDLRERFAALINAAQIDEIALMPNTATAINTAALGLPLSAGDNVLLLDGDYPANIYPWMNLAHRGVLTKMVPTSAGGLDLDLLVKRIDARTRVIALSTVQFATGFHNDLVSVGRICKERGIYLVVDGIQSLGALPLDVRAANIAMLGCGSQKWMLGPMGGGFLYVRRDVLDELAPGPYVGAGSVVSLANFLDYNFTLLPTAERFHIGTQNIAGLLGLHASLSLIQEVGVERVAERVLGLADVAIRDLQERGYRLAGSTAPEHRSGIVIAEVSAPEQTAARLGEAGIVCVPRGRGVRIAAHFYNTEDEILRVGAELDRLGARA